MSNQEERIEEVTEVEGVSDSGSGDSDSTVKFAIEQTAYRSFVSQAFFRDLAALDSNLFRDDRRYDELVTALSDRGVDLGNVHPDAVRQCCVSPRFDVDLRPGGPAHQLAEVVGHSLMDDELGLIVSPYGNPVECGASTMDPIDEEKVLVFQPFQSVALDMGSENPRLKEWIMNHRTDDPLTEDDLSSIAKTYRGGPLMGKIRRYGNSVALPPNHEVNRNDWTVATVFGHFFFFVNERCRPNIKGPLGELRMVVGEVLYPDTWDKRRRERADEIAQIVTFRMKERGETEEVASRNAERFVPPAIGRLADCVPEEDAQQYVDEMNRAQEGNRRHYPVTKHSAADLLGPGCPTPYRRREEHGRRGGRGRPERLSRGDSTRTAYDSSEREALE